LFKIIQGDAGAGSHLDLLLLEFGFDVAVLGRGLIGSLQQALRNCSRDTGLGVDEE
jgi:hypothetical protein